VKPNIAHEPQLRLTPWSSSVKVTGSTVSSMRLVRRQSLILLCITLAQAATFNGCRPTRAAIATSESIENTLM